MGSSRQKGHWEHALDFLEARCRQRHCGGTWLGSYEQWCSVSKPLCIFDGIYTPSAVYRPDAGKMCIAINFCLVATHGCNVMSERLFPFLLVLQAKKALSTRHGQQWNQVASVGVGPSTVLLNGEAHLESWNSPGIRICVAQSREAGRGPWRRLAVPPDGLRCGSSPQKAKAKAKRIIR